MIVKGTVVKGRQYENKPPTANIKMQEPLPVGVYVGEAYRTAEQQGSLDAVELGRSFVWVNDHQPDIAEAYITGYWGCDLYGQFLFIENLVELDKSQIRNLYDNAMNSWEEQYVQQAS